MPAPLELVDADSRCNARVEKKAPKAVDYSLSIYDFKPYNGALYMKGFKTAIYIEDQCASKPVDGSITCSRCAERKAQASADGLLHKGKGSTKYWQGLIGQAPPSMSPFNGSEKTLKIWENEWGVIRSTRSSTSSPSTLTSKKTAPVVKKDSNKKDSKSVPSTIAPTAVPMQVSNPCLIPPVFAKKVDIVEDDYVLNVVIGGYIHTMTRIIYDVGFTEEVEPIPDLDSIIGILKPGADFQKGVKADILPYIPPSEGDDASEDESEDEEEED
jgi:hypothetical protein